MSELLKGILTGLGSLLDISGAASANVPTKVYKVQETSPADDLDAIEGDFERIGNDMRKAMYTFDAKRRSSEFSLSE